MTQIKLQLPHAVEVIHVIRTADHSRAESHWHCRASSQRRMVPAKRNRSRRIQERVKNDLEQRTLLIDLLHKSDAEISNGGDEIESESKTLSPVSVSAAQDAKALERAQSVFDFDATGR